MSTSMWCSGGVDISPEFQWGLLKNGLSQAGRYFKISLKKHHFIPISKIEAGFGGSLVSEWRLRRR